jgi:hypothetical protein
MMKSMLMRAVGTVAAAATTFALFSAVASLADGDRAALLAARTAPTSVASSAAGPQLR